MSRLKTLIAEVHRRSLWQLLASYIVGAWLVLQIAETLASLIGLPLWFGAGVVVILAFGLVLVLTTGLVQVIAAYRSAPDRSYGGLRRLFSWKHALIAGLVALALLVLGTGGYMGLRSMGIGPWGTLMAKGVLEERDPIVLADFEEHAGDPEWADVATDLFRIDLSQSPTVRVAEPAWVEQALRRMGRQGTSKLDYELAREVAVREGLKAVLAGEISQVGASYVLTARLTAAQSGELLVGEQETARDTTEIIGAIQQLSRRMRDRVGESLATVRGSEPLARVSTSSLEALRIYSRGNRAFHAGEWDRAVALYEEAIALDTAFAMAYRRLGIVYRNRSERGRAVEALTRAYELRHRLPDRERYHVIASYHGGRGETEMAIAAYRTLLDIYPDDRTALHNLALHLDDMRDFEESARLYRQLIERDSSGSATAYTNLTVEQVALGRFDEAESTLQRAAEKFPGHFAVGDALIAVASARGDFEGAEAQLRAWAYESRYDLRSTRSDRWWLAYLAAVRGKIADAKRYLHAEMAANEDQGQGDRYLGHAIQLGLLDLLLLDAPDQAVEEVDAALRLYPLDSIPESSRPYLGFVSFYALAGRPDRAKALLTEAGEVRANARHRSNGLIALGEGRYTEAITSLQLWEQTQPASDHRAAYTYLGRAYDLAGAADSALAVYERYVTVPWRNRLPVDAHHLAFIYGRLGDLYEQRGDTAQAIHYYGKLIELWKDADPELQPRVESARRAIEALSTDR